MLSGSQVLLTKKFLKQYLVRKYYWPPPAFLLAKLPNPRIQQQRGVMDSRWTKLVQLVALSVVRSCPSFGSVLNFVNQFCRMATLRKLQLFTQTPMNEVFILTALLSNNSTKVSSYPMPVHFLLQRHPIKSNKSRKWSLWKQPPLIIQNKFPFFLSNLKSLENGLF